MICGARRIPADCRGFSIIELMIGLVLAGVVAAALLGTALGARESATAAQANSELAADVRRAMERLVRELRQAGTIDAVDLPLTPTDPTAITFWADFDNDGARDLNALDPEVLTYRYTPGSGQVTLTVNDADGSAVTAPILAANVEEFTLDLRSSHWEYDGDGDGVVGWAELDAAPAPVGNGNGKPDAAELAWIDSVVIDVEVADGERGQRYRTQVDFRNRHT